MRLPKPHCRLPLVHPIAWIAYNLKGGAPFDPWPFILLNLALSFQAAYAAPFIMISQNRQATRDRAQADADYDTNVKAKMPPLDVLRQRLIYPELKKQVLAQKAKFAADTVLIEDTGHGTALSQELRGSGLLHAISNLSEANA